MKTKRGFLAGLVLAGVIALSGITFATNFIHTGHQHATATEDERGSVPKVITLSNF